jgi:hypothetical protein
MLDFPNDENKAEQMARYMKNQFIFAGDTETRTRTCCRKNY